MLFAIRVNIISHIFTMYVKIQIIWNTFILQSQITSTDIGYYRNFRLFVMIK
ncbi:hypothetical protein SAMN05720487_10361 [Fibrobacter sp. UWT2]|nr:hypothetical protein SAMN05720487_10361 [Fibrobacter sp. UWT2]